MAGLACHAGYADSQGMILARLLGAQAASLLRPPFLPYWLGQSVSALGDRVTTVALPAVVLSLGGGATELARLASWSTGAALLLLLAGGVLVDRLSPRTVMLVTDGLRAVLLAVVAWQLARGGASITLLVYVSALLGACSAVFSPATVSILPQLVEDDQLVSANALRNLTGSLSGVIGPAVGGTLVALGGAGFALGVDALSFAAGFLGLFLMRPRKAAKRTTPGTPLWKEASEGFRIILASTWLWLTIAVFSVMNIFGAGLYVVLLPLYARQVLGGVQALGWLYAAQAVGAVLAALLLGRMGRVRRRGVVAYLAVVVQGGAILLLGVSHVLPLAMLALFLTGASITVFGVVWQATLQERVPKEALGRVASVDLLGGIALIPVGLLLVGRGVTIVGMTPGILICGGVAVVLAALALTTRAVRELD